MMSSLRSQPDPYTYRSCPSTPLGLIDPRHLSTPDIQAALNHARMGLELDYFSSPNLSRPTAPPSPYAPESHPWTDPESTLCSLICRTNLAATLANAQIQPSAKYAKIFPHLNDQGLYPTDFMTPRTVDSMRVLDNSQLDRIMQTYRLPLDLRAPAGAAGSSVACLSEGVVSSSRARLAKLVSLWENLGCWGLVQGERERERERRRC